MYIYIYIICYVCPCARAEPRLETHPAHCYAMICHVIIELWASWLGFRTCLPKIKWEGQESSRSRRTWWYSGDVNLWVITFHSSCFCFSLMEGNIMEHKNARVACCMSLAVTHAHKLINKNILDRTYMTRPWGVSPVSLSEGFSTRSLRMNSTSNLRSRFPIWIRTGGNAQLSWEQNRQMQLEWCSG